MSPRPTRGMLAIDTPASAVNVSQRDLRSVPMTISSVARPDGSTNSGSSLLKINIGRRNARTPAAVNRPPQNRRSSMARAKGVEPLLSQADGPSRDVAAWFCRCVVSVDERAQHRSWTIEPCPTFDLVAQQALIEHANFAVQ